MSNLVIRGRWARVAATLLLIAGCQPPAGVDAGVLDSGVVADEADGGAEDSGAPAALDAGELAPADAGLVADAGAPPDSRCVIGERSLSCAHTTTTLLTGLTGLAPREVHWQTPLGEPPADGWPAAMLFQGSLFTAELFWDVPDTEVFGAYNQGLLTKALLDHGFIVITPEARFAGFTAWDTNIPPQAFAWETAPDHALMLDIFDAVDDGSFGPIDAERLYAAGISSGGYMTSRMDASYRERFTALAIHSASYATCGGPLCEVPDDLSAAHLPTLFLHGAADDVVPIATMIDYRNALSAVGVEVDTVVDDDVGHAWLEAAPEAITSWFESHGSDD